MLVPTCWVKRYFSLVESWLIKAVYQKDGWCKTRAWSRGHSGWDGHQCNMGERDVLVSAVASVRQVPALPGTHTGTGQCSVSHTSVWCHTLALCCHSNISFLYLVPVNYKQLLEILSCSQGCSLISTQIVTLLQSDTWY